MNKKILTIWIASVMLLSMVVVIGEFDRNVRASGNGDEIQAELKVWDTQSQQWVNETDVIVGSLVTFKCTITNLGPYTFSNITITNIFPDIVDYLESGVAPYHVSSDNKIILISVPSQAACLHPGGTWSFTSLGGIVVSAGSGNNEMSIDAVTDEGTHFYDSDSVILHASDIGDIVQVETKVWDTQSQQWVDEMDVVVGDFVTFKCTITNYGPYDFSSIGIVNIFPNIVDYFSSGVEPFYVSPDNKIVSIYVPSQAACLNSGGTWSFESLVGKVVSVGSGDNEMAIVTEPDGGDRFYDSDTVTLHASDENPNNYGWIYGDVTGTTINDDTFPLENALVTVKTYYGGQFVDSTYTDSDGYYSISDIEAGTYKVEASKDGYGGVIQLNVVVESSIGTEVDLNLFESGYVFPSRVFGIVSSTNDEGNPFGLEDALVTVETPDGQFVDSMYTDSDGYYSISDIELGTYTVMASKDGYIGAVNLNTAVGGGVGAEVNFHLPKILDESGWIYGTVSGTNDDGDSFPLENAKVHVIGNYELNLEENSSGGVALQFIPGAITDSNGYYSISDIEPGTYTVEASKDGYPKSVQTNVVIESGVGTEINFNLIETKGGWIYGTVSDLPGIQLEVGGDVTYTSPIEDLLIEVHDGRYSGEIVASTYTDSTGYYEIYDIDAGFYSIIATKDGYSKHVKETVTVNLGEGTEFDFFFQPNPIFRPNSPLLVKAIDSGKVGGEIAIWVEPDNTFQHNISIYNGVEIKNLDIKKGSVSFTVSGNESGGGKTIAINIAGLLFDPSSEILVHYDGESIDMADDINDILDPNDDGSHPEYLIVIGSNGVQLLVSVPHFSEHSITFFNLAPEQVA
ncbi:MAG: carboxypeptidase regulatory-like domain-containing protein, partial [Candidatus Heimdallarchaeota archaeon]